MDTWVITVISLIASTALSTLIGCLIKNSVAKKVDEQQELLELREQQANVERKQVISETLTEGLQPVYTKLDQLSASLADNTTGTVTLLRETMKQARDHYMAQGYASASDVASWNELYNTYSKLGGNHFKEYVDAWKADVDKLPREHQVENK